MVHLSQNQWLFLYAYEVQAAYHHRILSNQQKNRFLQDAEVIYRAWVALELEFQIGQSILIQAAVLPQEVIREYPLQRLEEIIRFEPARGHPQVIPEIENRNEMNGAGAGGPNLADERNQQHVDRNFNPDALDNPDQLAEGDNQDLAEGPGLDEVNDHDNSGIDSVDEDIAEIRRAPLAGRGPGRLRVRHRVGRQRFGRGAIRQRLGRNRNRQGAPREFNPFHFGDQSDSDSDENIIMDELEDGRRLKLTDLMPPDFKGDGSQTAKEWLEKYLRYVRVHNLNDRVALSRAKYFLTGIAYTWFERKNFESVEEFSLAFMQQFGKYHSRLAMVDALNAIKLTPGVSVMKYLTDIQDLVSSLNLGQESILDAFLRGLPSSIQSAIAVIPHDDLEKLVDTVQKLIERDDNVRSTFDVGIPQFQQALSFGLNDINSQMENFTIGMEKAHNTLALSLEKSQKQLDDAIKQQQLEAQKKTETMANNTVSNNRGGNFRGRGTRGGRRDGRGGNSQRFDGNCYTCGAYGHASRYCFNNRRMPSHFSRYPNPYVAQYTGSAGGAMPQPPQYGGYEMPINPNYPPNFASNYPQHYGLPDSMGYGPYSHPDHNPNSWNSGASVNPQLHGPASAASQARNSRAAPLSLTGPNAKSPDVRN